MSVVSTNQNWKCVFILLCQETLVKSYHWGCSFSFFFQLEVVSQHHELRHMQHTNSCKQRIHNLNVIVLLHSWDSSGSFRLRESLLPRILLLPFLFGHLHEILPLARCHHQWGTTSRFRVVIGFTSALLCHTRFPTVDSSPQNTARHHSHCGFCRLHFSVQVEIESVNSRDGLE